MRVHAPAEGMPGQRRRRSLRKKVARWRPRNTRQVSFFGWVRQPDRANSANSPRHPANLCICTRLAFHLWVFSLLICSVRLGRSAVGRVLKYVRTQKDPFFQNGSRTGRTTGARRRDATAPRCEKRDIDYHEQVFIPRACRQMCRRRPL